MQHHEGRVHFPVHERHNNLVTALCAPRLETNVILIET
jgi:hypothetical protein